MHEVKLIKLMVFSFDIPNIDILLLIILTAGVSVGDYG